MTKKLALILGVVLSITTYDNAKAEDYIAYKRNSGHQQGDKNGNQDFRDKHNYPKKGEQDQNVQPQPGDHNSDDAAIIDAVAKKRRINFVEGGGMVVVQLLPDDTQGLPHQKWVVQLSNGAKMQAVYNTDMCEHVPIKVGDTVAMGGQFIWTNQGAMLHWLHYDPRQTRPDGYVELNGKIYCGDGPRSH